MGLTHTDDCPEENCNRELRVRDYGRPSRASPTAPVKEAICTRHGIVDSTK